MEEMALYGTLAEPSSAGPSRKSASQGATPKGKGKATSSKKRARSSTDAASSEAREKEADGADSSPATQEEDELYVCLRSDVVGVQHYTGLVGKGEYVMLRREPGNKYDENAVQVLNAAGRQVGHIPRHVAAQLAPLMDAGIITVEGRMIGQNMDRKLHYKLPLDVPIYGRPSHRRHIEPLLKWATPEGRGFDYMRNNGLNAYGDARLANIGLVVPGYERKSKAAAADDAALKGMLDGLAKVGDLKAADSVMTALTADLDVSKLQLHPEPPSLASGELMTDLLPHQSQALQWMIEHENPMLPEKDDDPAVQFWAKRTDTTGKYWVNVATKTPQAATPTLGRGGILADGMGLGKTLTMLALVLATKKDTVDKSYCRATLIVCPLSVLSNWERQIRDHVAEGKLTSYTYHGAGRGVSPNTLAKYDIVLTTYQTVTSDSDAVLPGKAKGKKAKGAAGPLSKVKWKRVVADEGHVMKNPKARMTMAVAALDAERRWVATGTPIVNAPNDLGSLLTCLHLCAPLDQPEYFRSLVLRPLKTGSVAGGRLLQAIVGQILLRRTKDTKNAEGNTIVSLPPIEYYQCVVKLDPQTRMTYDEVMKESARRFQQSMSSGEADVNILSMLTRMRQLCLSADLIPANYVEDLKAAPNNPAGPVVKIASLSGEDKDRLVGKLRQLVADQEECPICIDILDSPRITDCGHAFCLACITEVITRQAKCPIDRHALGEQSLLELPPGGAHDEEEVVAPYARSAKIIELLRYLSAFDKDDKTLVFSQFTAFLDRVAGVLQEEGIPYCRFDGSMSAKKRQEVIARFQTPLAADPGTPVVMLISLKSGAVGLNLTAASNVFLCDPWWQSAIEAQAVDRVHRMGQRKTVRVFQLIAEDTIEARVLDIQKRKDALVAQAFEHSGTKESKAAKKQARFEELKELLGV